MDQIIDDVIYQVSSLNIDSDMIKRLNKFFNALNQQLKGSNDSLIPFNDHKELLYDVVELLIEFKVIKLSHTIKLELFKALYNSGYFCYNPIGYKEFLDEFDYIKDDLRIINHIIDNNTFDDINNDLYYYLKELYLFKEPIILKDVLL